MIKNHTTPQTCLVAIQNGRKFGETGTFVTHTCKLLFDVLPQISLGKNEQKLKSHKALKYLKLPKCERIYQDVAILAAPGGEGDYYWLTDALPKLEILSIAVLRIIRYKFRMRSLVRVKFRYTPLK
ncbi:MAG: hypothetical protein BRC51_17235 [Cyanobacteria bacterium SW_12_48_29]|nr:MAG: hypothetical protein BRC43_05175 [Cyanobacteria bacterium QS_3_48_167]PSO89516.1 MAG: hypothetical protein BRC46_15790 [Cyanobacteria bacterium QS_6_48_18]PSO97347.1 MAG: hypothetical protein BRC51_17235 [Cyanobacteria bacterium SW_12_48_29]